MGTENKHPRDEGYQEGPDSTSLPSSTSKTTASVVASPQRDLHGKAHEAHTQDEFEVWHDCDPCDAENDFTLPLSSSRHQYPTEGVLQEIGATLYIERYNRSGCIHLAYFLGQRRVFSLGLPLRAVISKRYDEEAYCGCGTVDERTTPQAEDEDDNGPAGLGIFSSSCPGPGDEDEERTLLLQHIATLPTHAESEYPAEEKSNHRRKDLEGGGEPIRGGDGSRKRKRTNDDEEPASSAPLDTTLPKTHISPGVKGQEAENKRRKRQHGSPTEQADGDLD